MKKTLSILMTVIVIITISYFQQSCTKSTKDSTNMDSTFVFINSSESDSISNGLDSSLSLSSNRGAQWKLWSSFFKDCITNESWEPSDRTYFGTSNSIALGQLYDKKSGLFASVEPGKFIPPVIQVSENTSVCEPISTSGTDINLLLGTDIAKLVNADLQFAIQSAKESKLSISGFKISSLDFLKFNELLQDNSFKVYEEKASERRIRVIAKVLTVSGFKSQIKLDNNITAQLSAKLDSGITEVIKIDDTKMEIKFKRISEKIIEASSDKDFVVFVKLLKRKKI